jgi:2-polyprenyl-3-methyl-5-hydroxy-6-metoxy-1,4-benzoquinol methylase
MAPIFDGDIRSGGVGSPFVSGFKIVQCEVCNYTKLDPFPENLDKFYESDEYRSLFDGSVDAAKIQSIYDHEQNARLARIGVQNLRGITVAEFGSSAGVFLDAVTGLAKKTIAIEPTEAFHKHLEAQGHIVYDYPESAIKAGEKADMVVCFDVIEHVPDPIEFVEHAAKILNEGGQFILSMPNLDDLILKTCEKSFAPFFFQAAHLSYFSKRSVEALFKNTSFSSIKIGFLHKYGVDNLIRWSGEGTPGPSDSKRLFDESFNTLYRSEIERLGLASHLFIVATKKD